MICSYNSLSMGTPISQQLCPSGNGPWHAISFVWSMNEAVEAVCKGGIKFQLGNGGRALMWEDRWLDSVSLKEKFPRLYSISMQQHVNIKECGFWDGLSWLWNLV